MTGVQTCALPICVLDFDKAIRDPANPTQIRDGFHPGDHLHGTDSAYAAMAAAVDISLLR